MGKKISISKEDLEDSSSKGTDSKKDVTGPEAKGANESKTSGPKKWLPKKPAAKPSLKSSKKATAPMTKSRAAAKGFADKAGKYVPERLRGIHPGILIGSALAIFAVVFAATFVLLDLLKSDAQRTADALEYSTGAVDETVLGISEAGRTRLPYTTLQNRASDAGKLADAVDERADDLEQEVPDKPELTGPAVEAMASASEYLSSFAQLADVKDDQLGRRWARLKGRMNDAIDSLDDQSVEVVSVGVGSEEDVIPNTEGMASATTAASKIVVAANKQLQAWIAKKLQLQRACSVARSFEEGSASLISEYRAQRSDTQGLSDGPLLGWQEAVTALDSDSAARDDLAMRMDSLEAPPEAAASWQQMVQLVTQSRDTLDAASAGMSTEPFPSGRYWQGSYTQAEFDQASSQLSSSIDSTDQALAAQASQAVNTACNRPLPERPAV